MQTEEGFVSEFSTCYVFASSGHHGKITLQERRGMKRPVNQDDV